MHSIYKRKVFLLHTSPYYLVFQVGGITQKLSIENEKYRELTWKIKWQNKKGLMWFKVKFFKETSAFADILDVK
jgi:hypothetical protein